MRALTFGLFTQPRGQGDPAIEPHPSHRVMLRDAQEGERLGAGNQVHEHTAFDLGFERRIGRFKEYLPILTRLMNGETVSVEGRHYTLREATLRTQVPEVPIWIASGGEQMFDLTARYAQGW